VLSYDSDSNRYLIEWHTSKKQKYVSRLNLLFDDEDEKQFHQRVQIANELREEMDSMLVRFICNVGIKTSQKYRDFIKGLDVDIAPMQEFGLKSMLQLVTPEVPALHKELVYKLIIDIREEYIFAMKKSSYECQPGQEPIVYLTPNLVEIPEREFSFKDSLAAISSNLFIAQPAVVSY
jgi:hypothetical protein